MPQAASFVLHSCHAKAEHNARPGVVVTKVDLKHEATPECNLNSLSEIKNMNFEEQLIDLIMDNRLLYSKHDVNYKNVLKREECWKTIGAVLKCTAASCKARWKTLRERFTKELRKDEAATNEHERSRWRYYEQLLPIRDHIHARTRKTTSVFLTEDDTGQYSMDNDIDETFGHPNRSVSLSPSPEPSPEEVMVSEPPRKKKATENPDASLINRQFVEFLGDVSATISQSQKTKEDLVSVMLHTIGYRLKQLPKDRQRILLDGFLADVQAEESAQEEHLYN